MKKEIINNIKELIKGVMREGINHPALIPIDDGLCLKFKKDNIIIYVEYYKDGDIGLISEDYVNKKTIENIDLNREEVLPAIIKYYK